jgi:hypothetical protein
MMKWLRGWGPIWASITAAGVIIALIVTSPANATSPSIVGAWYVDAVGAPFAPHAMLFHDDGTVEITNPDAAEATNSSSDGMGAWIRKHQTISGQFLEVNADKTTHHFTTNLIVTFTLTVDGDSFSGPANATYYDGAGNVVAGPFPATLKGQRITADSGPPIVA